MDGGSGAVCHAAAFPAAGIAADGFFFFFLFYLTFRSVSIDKHRNEVIFEERDIAWAEIEGCGMKIAIHESEYGTVELPSSWMLTASLNLRPPHRFPHRCPRLVGRQAGDSLSDRPIAFDERPKYQRKCTRSRLGWSTPSTGDHGFFLFWLRHSLRRRNCREGRDFFKLALLSLAQSWWHDVEIWARWWCGGGGGQTKTKEPNQPQLTLTGTTTPSGS